MPSASYKSYLLHFLMVVLAFNFVDRLALGLLLQDIKVDLTLSDTQLGLLSGMAFALFYAVMGIPIARWADRGNRVAIISITTALWSVAVALCGMAGSFFQLLAIRIGVAVGEAGCIPPAQSLIADHFTRAERPRATARYLMGNPLSLLIGYFLAGWLNELYGWRITFAVLGLPGLALAAMAWFTLREPRRAALSVAEPATPLSAQPSLREVCRTLWSNVTFRHVLLGFSVIYFFGYGMGKWQPTYFIRSFGMSSGELGTWFAICGLVGVSGMYLGGELASRYAAGNERLQLQASVVAVLASAVIQACIYLACDPHVAFGFLALSFVVFNMTSGPLFATVQTLVPARMRAMAIAFVYLFINLIGFGLGPLAAGVLSDVLRPSLADESLRYALIALCPGYLWAGWHLWRASASVTRDLAAAQTE
jgi:predicted MFS family arabinose efflux permease